MSEHVGGAAETGAAMDYSEHEKTYTGFLAMTKYGSIAIIALLIAMAASSLRSRRHRELPHLLVLTVGSAI